MNHLCFLCTARKGDEVLLHNEGMTPSVCLSILMSTPFAREFVSFGVPSVRENYCLRDPNPTSVLSNDHQDSDKNNVGNRTDLPN